VKRKFGDVDISELIGQVVPRTFF